MIGWFLHQLIDSCIKFHLLLSTLSTHYLLHMLPTAPIRLRSFAMRATLLCALLCAQRSIAWIAPRALAVATSSQRASTLIPEGIPDDARELMLNSLSDVTIAPTVKPKEAKGKPVSCVDNPLFRPLLVTHTVDESYR